MGFSFLARGGLVCVALLTWSSRLPATDRITADCRVNGKPVSMAIDTGASTTALFNTAAQRLHLEVTSPPSDARVLPGETLAGRTEPLKFEVLGLPPVEGRLHVLDHVPYLSLDIDGVIGWPNIRRNLWLMSGSKAAFRLLKEAPPESASWFEVREFRPQTTLTWELPAGKSGPVVRLGVDTGADSGVRLSPAAWAEWRKIHARAPVTLEAYFMPGAGFVIVEQAWADEIDLGGLTLHGVTVTSMNPSESEGQAPHTLAVLGLDAILRTDAVLDGANERALIKPLRNEPPVPAHNRLGAVFAPQDPRTDSDLVAHVAVNSPAAQAGISDGDVLLKIDDLDVTVWRTQPGILPLRRFWIQPAGSQLRLTLRRGSQTMQSNVTLRDILGPHPSIR